MLEAQGFGCSKTKSKVENLGFFFPKHPFPRPFFSWQKLLGSRSTNGTTEEEKEMEKWAPLSQFVSLLPSKYVDHLQKRSDG